MDKKYLIAAGIVAIVMVIVAVILVFLQLNPGMVTPPGTITGTVTGAGNVALPGVTVFYQKYTDHVPPQVPSDSDPHVVTDANGHYAFPDGVLAGNYKLTFSMVTVNGVHYAGKSVSGIVVKYGPTVCDVTLGFPGIISGRVTNAAGTVGLANVNVYLNTTTTPVMTDAQGNYMFTNIDPGMYDVSVHQINNGDGSYYNAKTVANVVVTESTTTSCDVALDN